MKWRMTGILCHLPGGDFAGLIVDASARHDLPFRDFAQPLRGPINLCKYSIRYKLRKTPEAEVR